MTDWILHVDLDQFLAAVEVLRRPELAGRPVVVGGDGDPSRPRQVVATASYEARAFGVRSGMPLRLAARKCPDAVFLPSDRPAYDAASARVMATLRSFPVVVEVWGWDEAFVGVRTDDPEALARAVQGAGAGRDRADVRGRHRRDEAAGEDGDRVRQAGRRRPADPAHVDRDDGRPTRHGDLGHRRRARRRRLAEPASGRSRELARADHHELARRFGPTIGPHLKVLGLGGDDSPVVDEPHVARSRSREETFEHDLTEPRRDRRARRPAGDRGDRVVVAEGRRVTHVAVKVRTATFFTRTKISKLAGADHRSGRGGACGARRARPVRAHRPVRLLGVRVLLEAPINGTE